MLCQKCQKQQQQNKIMKNQEKQDGIVDGFQSEQQQKLEQKNISEVVKPQTQSLHKEEVKFKIPPPQQIKDKSYSLHPDMETGWAPKSQLPVPIPMFYQNKRVDSLVKKYLQRKHDKMRLVYLGPRYENTFYAWYDKQFQFPYSHIKAPHNMKFTNRAFCGQHWDAQTGPTFDSYFQSGNLDAAIQVDERQFDIYLRVDSNTRGHLQWFNFRVTKLEKLQKYRFNICNLQKHKSLYIRGQKPFIFSTKRFQKQKKGWEQMGDSLKFQQKPGKSAKMLNIQHVTNYKLSFDYYTQYQNDRIQIAYCIPYTYTQLLSYLNNLQKRLAKKNFFTMSKLCQSLGGNNIPLLTIHENFNKDSQQKLLMDPSKNQLKIKKKCVIISGRVHPGQSNGSHMMEGFLQFLCGDSKQAKYLRENIVFKIVPMLNPDGVILGNYRTGVSGRDFNRQYRNPDKAIFPQVYSFKKFVVDNKALYRQNLLMFLDFHGHSTKKNVFAYGPQFPIIQRHYYQCRVFPKLLGNKTNMFRYYSCSFKVSQFKQSTARAIFLRRVMIPLSYTIQASNGSYYDHEQLKDIPFNGDSWIQMGKKIASTLAQYADLVLSSQKYRMQKLNSRKTKKDIKIRKTSKPKGNTNELIQSQSNLQKQVVLLDSTHNDKVKKIFQEIKKAEQQKLNQKNQQDDISQGSSDGEGQKDDLSPQKLNLLFKIIRNKKANISQKYKKKLQDDQKHFKTNQRQDLHVEGQHLQLSVKQVEFDHNNSPQSIQQQQPKQQQIFRPNVRGYFLRNKNQVVYLPNQQKKQKIAAKIINFSFIGHSKNPNFSAEKRPSHRVQIQQPSSLTKIQKSLNQPYSINRLNNRVLDLSDNSFRQTCINSLAKDGNSSFKPSSDRKNLTFTNISPRKLAVARLEEYKYKRLFIDQYKI